MDTSMSAVGGKVEVAWRGAAFGESWLTRSLADGEALGDFELAVDGRFFRWKAAGGMSGKKPLRRINDGSAIWAEICGQGPFDQASLNKG